MSNFDTNLKSWIQNMGFSASGHGLPLKLANNGVESMRDILYLSRKEWNKIFLPKSIGMQTQNWLSIGPKGQGLIWHGFIPEIG